ncbi:SWIM zinc finger family protein [Niallia circulans]
MINASCDCLAFSFIKWNCLH